MSTDLDAMIAERNEMMQRIEAVGARTQCRLDRLDEMCEQKGWRSPPDLRLVGDDIAGWVGRSAASATSSAWSRVR